MMEKSVVLWPIALAAVCALIGSCGQLFFKMGSGSVGDGLLSWVTNWRILLGMGLYGLSAVLFIVALKHGELSILYPVIATSYIWVSLLSSRLLGETFSPVQWVGVTMILGGIAIVVRR